MSFCNSNSFLKGIYKLNSWEGEGFFLIISDSIVYAFQIFFVKKAVSQKLSSSAYLHLSLPSGLLAVDFSIKNLNRFYCIPHSKPLIHFSLLLSFLFRPMNLKVITHANCFPTMFSRQTGIHQVDSDEKPTSALLFQIS